MHVRTGLDTPYLSPEFLEDIRFCVEKAKEKHMLAWLYDEDRWPSGAAGGFVTKIRLTGPVFCGLRFPHRLGKGITRKKIPAAFWQLTMWSWMRRVPLPAIEKSPRKSLPGGQNGMPACSCRRLALGSIT